MHYETLNLHIYIGVCPENHIPGNPSNTISPPVALQAMARGGGWRQQFDFFTNRNWVIKLFHCSTPFWVRNMTQTSYRLTLAVSLMTIMDDLHSHHQSITSSATPPIRHTIAGKNKLCIITNEARHRHSVETKCAKFYSQCFRNRTNLHYHGI